MMTRSSWFLIAMVTVVGMGAATALHLAAPEPVPVEEDRELHVIVRNEGGEPLPAGVPVSVSVWVGGVETPIALLHTPGPLAPGETSPPLGVGVARADIVGDIVVRTRDDGAHPLHGDSGVWVIPGR